MVAPIHKEPSVSSTLRDSLRSTSISAAKMDLRPLTLVMIVVALVARCEEDSANASTTPRTTTGIGNATLPSLCSSCNCTGEIINCSNRGLENHFEDSQWPTMRAKEITFAGNELVRVRAFPRLAVERLTLRENRITKIDYCAFKQLDGLTELDLSRNQLDSEMLQPHVFEGKFSPISYEPLSKLTVLNLSHNVLHSLHQDVFEHLGNLKVLDLAGNPFTTIDLRTSLALSSLAYLEELDLSYCQIDTLPDDQFRMARHLRKLSLSGNRLRKLPAALERLSALEQLYLDENPLETLGQQCAFPSLPNLKELSLCCMPHLIEIGEGAFSRLTSLESLRIQNCPKLESIDERALVHRTAQAARWPPLKKLDLSDNALRHLPSQLVGRWDWLEELDLTNNKWSCDCENQYLIGTLLPNYGRKLMGEESEELKCAAPAEHADKNLTSLSHRRLRCLDLYEARPEKDAAILIGVLVGLLLALPLGFVAFAFWRRGFFFCGSSGPATFSRAFYKRAANDEDN
ncbi:hypothetical protein KM043_001500 [Ampulex compressa]|nr:hypothetical protein KM043_001500 [Ampulex compressa]